MNPLLNANFNEARHERVAGLAARDRRWYRVERRRRFPSLRLARRETTVPAQFVPCCS